MSDDNSTSMTMSVEEALKKLAEYQPSSTGTIEIAPYQPTYTGGGLKDYGPGVGISPYDLYPSRIVIPARITVPNKKVAVEPFPEGNTKATVKGGVLQPINQASLTPLKVVFSSDAYKEGSVIFVRSKLGTGHPLAKEIFEAFGKRFILVPEEEVVLVDRNPTT